MERPQIRRLIGIGLMTVVTVVGIVGLKSAYGDEFARLTPFSLMVSASVIALDHRLWNRSFLIRCIFIFISGFIIEDMGVRTGLIFGHYSYGYSLGWKADGIPLIIGLNWLVLSYSAWHVTKLIRIPPALIPFAGALLMTGLDYLLEPFAVRFHLWRWNGAIPVQNYIAWLLLSGLFIGTIRSKQDPRINITAVYYLFLQIIFFVCV